MNDSIAGSHLFETSGCKNLKDGPLDLQIISFFPGMQIKPCSKIIWIDVFAGNSGGPPCRTVGLVLRISSLLRVISAEKNCAWSYEVFGGVGLSMFPCEISGAHKYDYLGIYGGIGFRYGVSF